MASLVSLTECPGDLSLLFHGLLLPKETHSAESLRFAQEFRLKDSDVVAVTYPKSGWCFCSFHSLSLPATPVVWTVDSDRIASVQQVDNLTQGIFFFFLQAILAF